MCNTGIWTTINYIILAIYVLIENSEGELNQIHIKSWHAYGYTVKLVKYKHRYSKFPDI